MMLRIGPTDALPSTTHNSLCKGRVKEPARMCDMFIRHSNEENSFLIHLTPSLLCIRLPTSRLFQISFFTPWFLRVARSDRPSESFHSINFNCQLVENILYGTVRICRNRPQKVVLLMVTYFCLANYFRSLPCWRRIFYLSLNVFLDLQPQIFNVLDVNISIL